MTGRPFEADFELAHCHHADRTPEMVSLRAVDAEDRPGPLHGLIVRAASGTWFWTCHLCVKDLAGYTTDAQAWAGFLEHEDQAHTSLAPIVSLDEYRRSRHAS